MHKTTGESWNQYSLFILVLSTLLCVLKTTDEVCDPPKETSHSGANHAVFQAQNDRSCLGPIESCYSGPEGAVLHAKTTGGVLDPQRLVILVLKTLFWMHKTTGESWN